MTESLITMSITGLIVGFFFSMPIAGPISILITSNALKGRLRYCNLATIGASIADFIYVFIAVFSVTRFYSFYKPAVPYILLAGMAFLIYTGYRIIKSKVEMEDLEDKKDKYFEKIKDKDKGAFYAGCMINLLNPTLFIGWLTSSFFVISFVASLGFNTGEMDIIIKQNVDQINNIEGRKIENSHVFSNIRLNKKNPGEENSEIKGSARSFKHFHLLISISYAFFLSVGSIIWFYLLAFFITRFRHRINLKIINGIIYSFGTILCLFGVYFGFISTRMLFFPGY